VNCLDEIQRGVRVASYSPPKIFRIKPVFAIKKTDKN